MSVYPSAFKVEMIFSGAIWTDVSSDVRLDQGLAFHYGMAGGGPTDRVASTGWAKFSLDNDTTNSAHLQGYYAPLNANCRAGFAFGISVRISFQYGGTWYYKWRGTLSAIDPVAGKKNERMSRCLCVDWFNEPANYNVRDVALQINQTSDVAVSTIIAQIAKQPPAQIIQTGADTYVYALDDVGRGGYPAAASVFQNILMSELGFFYQMGDTVQGGTVKFENRHTRPLTTTNQVTFNDDMVQISVPTTLDRVWNRVEVTTHPRTVDAAATTVLFSLTSQPVVAAMQSITISGNYRDPNQTLSLVGGTAMVAPVAVTDYRMNTASDGSGSDVTASFTVAATYYAATVQYVITNNGVLDGYVTFLQARGKGLYAYSPELSISQDTTVQGTQGLRVLQIDMPYQASRVNGQGAADWIRSLYSVAQKQVDTITFIANTSNTFMVAALAREISDRIGTTETVTGVSATGNGWFINAVDFNVQPTANGLYITCQWTLAPADSSQAWILEDSQYGLLESTTILGYL